MAQISSILVSDETERVEVAPGVFVRIKKEYTYGEAAAIAEQFTNLEKPTTADARKVILKILETAIVGWEGVTDAQGADIPWKPEYVDKLKLDVAMRVAEEVMKLLAAQGAEKKSESANPPRADGKGESPAPDRGGGFAV